MVLLDKVIANFTGAVRNDSMGGKTFIVAPMIMILEGVHEGSQGPVYYPAEELAKTAQVWNMKPVVLYHPQANGIGISACDPDVISNRGLGVIMNTKFEDGKLKAEAWLEVDRCNKIDERIMEAIENNNIMELSTGLYAEADGVEGIWNEEAYISTVMNFKPDHLALLPDLEGACSVEDGAGFLRLNQKKNAIMVDKKAMSKKQKKIFKNNSKSILNHLKSILVNEMSHDVTRSLIWTALDNISENAWIMDVFDDFFIYSDDGKLWKQNYLATDGKVELVGDPEPVVQIIEYRTISGSVIGNNKETIKNRKGTQMDKEKMVQDLIDNKNTAWKEEHKESLIALEDDVLANMIPIINKEESKEEEVEEDITENAEKTDEQYINELPKNLQGAVRNSMVVYEASKARLIKVILGNKKNSFTDDQLNLMELPQLQNIALLAAVSKEDKEVVNEHDYSGMGIVVENEQAETEEAMEAPVLNFNTEKEKVA